MITRVELRPGPFVPGELLRSIVTALKADTAESGARLIVEVDPALPGNLSGDAGRIQHGSALELVVEPTGEPERD